MRKALDLGHSLADFCIEFLLKDRRNSMKLCCLARTAEVLSLNLSGTEHRMPLWLVSVYGELK